MNLNFWQWLGVILLVGGAAFYVYENFIDGDKKPAKPAPPASTQPI